MRKKRKTVIPEAYLTLVPRPPNGLRWTEDKDGPQKPGGLGFLTPTFRVSCADQLDIISMAETT